MADKTPVPNWQRDAFSGSGGPRSRQEVGARGEDLAAAALEAQGMVVVTRNWRCRLGEIDIIAVEEGRGHRTLVFCEVKCRTGLGYGRPLESITHAKLRKLRQLAAQWMATDGAGSQGGKPAVRVDQIRLDAVGVLLIAGRLPELTHVRGIG